LNGKFVKIAQSRATLQRGTFTTNRKGDMYTETRVLMKRDKHINETAASCLYVTAFTNVTRRDTLRASHQKHRDSRKLSLQAFL